MKVGKYLLISTTVLGLVNPLVALADDQNNTKLSQPLESVEHSDNQRDSQKLGDKNKSSELYNTSNVKEDGVSPDRDKTEKTSVKPVADSEHIKFADANLEKIVIKALHIPSSQNYVTLDDIKNFSGNYLPIQNIFADSIEFSSLEGLEALKNLPSNIPVELSLRLKPNVSLKPISNLNLKWGLSIDKDGKWTSEDIKALNSINVVDGGLYSGLELSAGYDSTQNKDGLTNEQIKELDPLFSEVINKGTSLINLNAQAISDFTYFNKFKNIQLSATNQYNIFNDSPITLKEGAKNISFNSQIKGIDGTRLTDDIYTWNTSDHKEGMNYGPINGKNGIYTINNYIDYSQVPGYIVSYASYMDESGNYKRHSYANGNTLLYSGYSYYKTVKEDELKIVNVNYVDEEGNSLANSEVLRGNVGDSYKADEKTIPGYIFAEAKDGNESGKFTDKPQTVTMIYKKLKDNTPVMPVQDGTLTVKYVDENGKEIAKSVVTKEKAGTAYKTEKKDIEGYTFKEVKGNEVGKYVAGNQTVTYVYTKNDNHNVTPTDPNKPDTPNDSGQTNQPGNNNVGKDTGSSDGNVVNNVVNGIQSALPKTAAEKTTLAGVISVVLTSLAGLVFWNRRK